MANIAKSLPKSPSKAIERLIMKALEASGKEYQRIVEAGTFDVKPKEDQIKCAIYSSFREEEYLVQVEAATARHGKRCDLRIIGKAGDSIAIEIKTAWAGVNWNNKPIEQGSSWLKDVKKLSSLADFGTSAIVDRFFVLMVASQDDCDKILASQIEALKNCGATCLKETKKIGINNWNGLNRLTFYLFRIKLNCPAS
ncbi:hypothetical protein [Dongia sp.]|uniref:hypothetical protein n=1 Tax=Dongia sp. TaxID=1977262 RepID=UPI0035ADADA8